MMSHPPLTQLFFELSHFRIEQWRAIVLRIRSSKSQTSHQSHGLKFGMVGTYNNSYFQNVKRKVKVTFDHGTTLRNIDVLVFA